MYSVYSTRSILLQVEAMKMIMAIKSTESGVINHNLSPGSIISGKHVTEYIPILLPM